MKVLLQLVFCGFCYWAGLVYAGQVVLSNGDDLTGELVGVEGDDVVWKSETLGELRLPKSQVRNLRSITPLKIRGQDKPCLLYEMVGRKVRFLCGGKRKRYSLSGLKHVVPYANHAALNYAYGGNLRITGWKQTGNTHTEYQEIMSDVRLRHGDLRHEMRIIHNSQRTTTHDFANDRTFKTYNRRSLASYSLSWFFVPRWFWANTVSAEQDDNRNIQEEYRAASGIGHSFWETAGSSLDLEAGLQYNRTYLAVNPPAHQPDTYPAIRLATNFRYKLKNAADLYHKNQFNHSLVGPDPGESERWELRTDTGVNLPIGFGISANFSMEWAYVNHARDQNPNASRQDTTYRVGVNYTW